MTIPTIGKQWEFRPQHMCRVPHFQNLSVFTSKAFSHHDIWGILRVFERLLIRFFLRFLYVIQELFLNTSFFHAFHCWSTNFVSFWPQQNFETSSKKHHQQKASFRQSFADVFVDLSQFLGVKRRRQTGAPSPLT